MNWQGYQKRKIMREIAGRVKERWRERGERKRHPVGMRFKTMHDTAFGAKAKGTASHE